MDSLIPTVEKLLRQVAEQEILTRFNNLKEADIQFKDDHGDPVTTADLEAENRIQEGLLKILPESHVIGEEGAFKYPKILEKLNENKTVWLVDPLDGTRNFSSGKACYAVICALVLDGRTEMGWVLDPVAGICITVQRGKGAYCGAQKLNRIYQPDTIHSMTGSISENIQRRLHKLDNTKVPGRFVRYHCVGREYMDLALGKLQFALYGGKLMPWDHAAGVLMLEETGAFVRSVETKAAYSPRHSGSSGEQLLIAPNEPTFDSLIQIISSKK
ncbi:MAG: inositol monophosphatase [Magnetovibrio sp.]|nr:inositol monophosphatase [Magnetovibrio sp.]